MATGSTLEIQIVVRMRQVASISISRSSSALLLACTCNFTEKDSIFYFVSSDHAKTITDCGSTLLQLGGCRNDNGMQMSVLLPDSRGDITTVPGPIGVEIFAARLVEALIGVGAKVIPLRLQQVGRQEFTAIPIKK